MHVDEIETNEALVRRLLAAQFPQWARLPVAGVSSTGADHAIYRLGDRMAVRLPRIHWATAQGEKESRWLPVMAPRLPLTVPAPLARGEPGEGYPWRWSVVPWLAGEPAAPDRLDDPRLAAIDLARFIQALRRIDPTGGPPPGAHNFGRGEPLPGRDTRTRLAIAALHGTLDTDAVTGAWESALRAPAWPGPPVWVHGDLQAGNLLAVGGRLSAVIDWGGLAVGDPACDLMVAWNLFEAGERLVFRATLGADDATWARGRGWALSVALIALPYYQSTNPVLAAASHRTIRNVLADH